MVEFLVQLVGIEATGSEQVERIPGSMEPARVPIIRPSSGVRPMDVATDRPPSTAVTEQPLPRWATTVRSSPTGRASKAAARSADQATEMPWKP